jgi:hypothetical protein
MRPISGLATLSAPNPAENSGTNRNKLWPIAAAFAPDNIAIVELPEFGSTAG